MRVWPFRVIVFLLLSALLSAASLAESSSDAIAVKQSLDRLGVVGSVLMIAAHPDDENTALISYLARGRKVRMAYLSLTRGEGGQNAIGPEQGAELGIIRTQELLQSRRIDGGIQYFSRAIDFGYSKSPEETIQKWGHDAILSDIVWVIRKFRPDVVILQFTGTYRDGHGHHQASAILGREAYEAAGDAKRFPEQLQSVKPWHAQRLMVNRRGFSRESQREIAALPKKIDLDMGAYDPLLGYSYGELAGISRSFNRSQSEGTPRMRGSVTTTLVTVAGRPASKDLFDGIDITWNRFPGGAAVAQLLREAEEQWKPDQPEAVIATLAKAREAAAKIATPEAEAKLAEFDEAIAQCAGLWLDFSADRQSIVAGGKAGLAVKFIRRTNPSVTIQSIDVPGSRTKWQIPDGPLEMNHPVTARADWMVPADHLSQPYWLREEPKDNLYSIQNQKLIGIAENTPELTAVVKGQIGNTSVTLQRPLVYRYLDKLEGETVKPVAVVPRASSQFLQPTILFLSRTPKTVPVEITAEDADVTGTISFDAPKDWTVSPSSRSFSFVHPGEQKVLYFDVTPHNGVSSGTLQAKLQIQGQTVTKGLKRITYSHIPMQTYFPPAQTKLVRINVQNAAKQIGYVMGAGDEMPAALRQMDCDVTLLNPGDLAQRNLEQFDAIVTGVRAYAERADLRANQSRLLDYVAKGGTLIVQYNRLERGASSEALPQLGPYPFRIGFERVSVEEAPVKLQPKSPLLSAPNQITPADFDGWVQERGLYFASSWDPHYQTLFEMNDPGEDPLKGATIVARYGKGVYVYTALSWFRQLPAGVPGAYRIFANLLNASKTFAATP